MSALQLLAFLFLLVTVCHSAIFTVFNYTYGPVRADVDEAVNCTDWSQNGSISMPDLLLDLQVLQSTTSIHNQSLETLQCAMEERCLSQSAYLATSQPISKRKLLRFTTLVFNKGNAPFLPNTPKSSWRYHQCHQHFHSMELFTLADLFDQEGNKVAEGHKASFCLFDTGCNAGIEPVYDCCHQGISAGCYDVYEKHLDCQWIDVSDVEADVVYNFKVSINPFRRIAEMDFSNNAVNCFLKFSADHDEVAVYGCHHEMP